MSAPPKMANLLRESDHAVVARACGACGRVYGLNDQWAGRCCYRECEDCHTPIDTKGGWSVCRSCRDKRDAAREAELRAKATRVSEGEYAGPVYYDGAWNEGFLRDVDEFREWWETNHEADEAMPEAVWACTSRRLQIPNAEQIIDDATSDSFEDAADQFPPTDALQAAIDAYNAQVTVDEWNIDHSRLVVLAPEPSHVV